MKKERIWVVSEVFYPDTDIATANIATEIALKFRENFEVHVICGPQDYERKNSSVNGDELEDIHIHRWKFFNYNKNHKIKRLIRVIGISLGLFFYGFKIKKTDKAFVISNPAFITPFFGFLKWLKGFEYILLMHDVFPENLIVGGYIKETNICYRLTRALFVRSRVATDKIIVIGRDMKALLLQHFPRHRENDIRIIPNWADTDAVFPIDRQEHKILEELQLQNKLIILFAGNHGILQNLLAFLKIVEQTNNPSIHYVFAGGGATKSELENYAAAHNMSNVSFLPPFQRSENNSILNSCHIGLVSLTDSLYGVGVPSKSYNILSAGKPILFLGNTQTEIAQFVTENNLGWAFEYKHSRAVIDFLNTLTIDCLPDIMAKGAKGRELVKDYYTKEEVLEQIISYVD
ncbi:MAG: glycosyltransferase family 4 protein [Niabella sp.]